MLKEELRSFNPDVVGITSVTPSIYEAYKVAETAKKVREDCIGSFGWTSCNFHAEANHGRMQIH
jgi:hypothetical protein